MEVPHSILGTGTPVADREQPTHEVTRILSAIQSGDLKATDELLPIVYDELRRLARQKLSQEKPGQTLQATALVHEAYIRLVGAEDPGWENRGHFFVAAAEAMRRILVERARYKGRLKRGGGLQRVDLDEAELPISAPTEDLVALDEALEGLTVHDPLAADVVKLRYFAGLTNEETGKVLGVSAATVKRHWRYARVWLLRAINAGKQ
ncbi:MAG: sigma-70 family RNA polymerase sigma factor [Candidatus Brocadiae bacterium]|nr:sigma-70 family RNA polymerase sigma factor [Candidatus Brocadiia bacterium]